MRHFNKDSRDYAFIDQLEAGISLTGSDVKSLRTQTPQYKNSKVEIKNGLPILQNLYIPPYKYSQNKLQDTTHDRLLLLNKKQIARLQSYRNQKYMLIPIAIYLKGVFFKLEIGIGRKMKKYEKREKIKAKEIAKRIRV